MHQMFKGISMANGSSAERSTDIASSLFGRLAARFGAPSGRRLRTDTLSDERRRDIGLIDGRPTARIAERAAGGACG
ncbi:hypothetical protein EYW49_07905 [Siculibacillus lacustris]|uniref:Uncharacterized protein n=1 Tax=Siculibacillus lacustris TaxID=1549641 RepID=A0A4Q9VT26_9HYPH|nr:hypothetical protein [Siculibacillus lacustris]TBW39045.1 hypothetical protein EYW49_07905 [Siculibacillus lacustris]